MIRSYADYLYREAKLDRNELNTIASEITRVTEESSKKTYYIDLSQYKSPIKTFGGTQLGVGYKMDKGHNSMKLYFLPASNTLSDDNREYFNENLLKLGELSLLLTDNAVRLESFQLYAMKSLIPWNEFVKGLSGEFRLGIEEHYDSELKKHVSANASGGIGLTRQISADMNVYLLMNGGSGYGNSRLYLYFYPEVGATIYEIMNMKTILSYKYIYNQLGSKDFYHNFDITQSVFLQKKFKLSASFERRFNERYSNNTYEVMFHVYF